MSDSSAFDFSATLTGPTITLRPLRAEDFDELYAAASDPLIWEQHPDPLRHQREVFRDNFFLGGVSCGSAFVVTEKASGRVIGSSRYYEWDAARKEVAIGYTFLVRDHWGGATNAEMKRLMLDHAFRWAEVVWLHIGADNWRSRKAAEKIGAVLSHVEEREAKRGLERQAFYKIHK
jgi:RimJ/RimL family protein N-acetyltransferase